MLKWVRVDIPHVGAVMAVIGFVRQPRTGHYALPVLELEGSNRICWSGTKMKRWMRNLIVGASTGVVVFGLIQLVPYRVSNAPVTGEPRWDSPQTRALVVAACYDCHSNQTKTPWYGKIAPISWWLTNHVDNGRKALNFSEWNSTPGRKALRAARSVQRGSMPPSYYTWFGLHSNAKLTSAQRAALIAGLTKTLGLSPPASTTSG
jgi:hypothetical protein